MNGEVRFEPQTGTVVVCVPLRQRRRGGRKTIVGEVRAARLAPADGSHRTVLKALGRAYRWKRMLESGEFSSITDLAKAEKINHSYVRRVLRLTLLSPDITEMILSGDLAKGWQLEDLLKAAPGVWAGQEAWLK